MEGKNNFINILNNNTDLDKKISLSQFYHIKFCKFPFNFVYDILDENKKISESLNSRQNNKSTKPLTDQIDELLKENDQWENIAT